VRIDGDLIRYDAEGRVLEILDDEEEILAIFKEWVWARIVEDDLKASSEDHLPVWEAMEGEVLDTASTGPTDIHDAHELPDGSFEDPRTQSWPAPTSSD
jgi:hypothetical protein